MFGYFCNAVKFTASFSTLFNKLIESLETKKVHQLFLLLSKNTMTLYYECTAAAYNDGHAVYAAAKYSVLAVEAAGRGTRTSAAWVDGAASLLPRCTGAQSQQPSVRSLSVSSSPAIAASLPRGDRLHKPPAPLIADDPQIIRRNSTRYVLLQRTRHP